MSVHIGSDFEDFLKEQGVFEETEAAAVKKVVACMIEQAMGELHMPKTAMARKIGTSRSQLDRLLDPTNTSVTLSTLVKAASAIGKKLKISFEEDADTQKPRAA